MNDLKDAWNELKNSTSDLTQISEQEVKLSITQKSKGTMETLRKNVFYKFFFIVFFTICIAVLISLVAVLVAQILLTILLAAYIVGGVLIYQEYRELGAEIDPTQDLSSNLIDFRNRIKKVLRYEELIGLILYPISVSAGCILGMSRNGGSYMDKPFDWIVLGLALIIGVPLSNWAAKKMNKKAFGEYLDRLDLNIAELAE